MEFIPTDTRQRQRLLGETDSCEDALIRLDIERPQVDVGRKVQVLNDTKGLLCGKEKKVL